MAEQQKRCEIKAESKREYRRMWKSACSQRHKWKRISKIAGHPSSTAGSTKGDKCQASSMDRFFAKYSRATRHPGYQAWRKSHQRG